MNDTYLMDGHKLYWHLDRVTDWQNGKRIAPIHIDVGLSKGCNIKCEYCYGVTQGNIFKKGKDSYFPREPLLRYMRDAGAAGVRSMAIIGEAEPTLNPALYEAILEGKKAGIDMALATNGILFDDDKDGEKALEVLSWIRFNISAASDDAYRRIHGSKEFATCLRKIEFCVQAKQRKQLSVTVGLQMVLTPRNVDQVVPLAELGRELGVDYLVVKQCSDTQDNDLGYFNRFDEYDTFNDCLQEAEEKSTESYNVIVKWGKISNKGRRDYDQCTGVPFLLYSSGDGCLYPCGMFFYGDKESEFRMGDLKQQSFTSILQNDRYWEIVDKVSCIDVHNVCYANCRTHAINDFLWKLSHPPAHVNFV